MSKWQYILAALNTVGFFGIIAFMMISDTELPQQFDKPFSILIGALAVQYATVISYFFGSSKGSSDKNETIKKAIEKR